MSQACNRWIRRAVDFSRFTRLSVVGFTWALVLLGAYTSGLALSATRLCLLILAATAFHFFAYVSNDVIDLALDRTVSSRQADPLARGSMAPWIAAVFAGIQVPLAMLLDFSAGARGSALTAFCASFVLMAIYNLFGKRLRWPILTDMAQGLSWGLLVVCAALTVGSSIPARTAITGASILIYITLANGIHGALRDLHGDKQFGARTTAIWLGADTSPGGHIIVSRSLRWYAYSLSCILTVLCLSNVAVDRHSEPTSAMHVSILIVLILAVGVILLGAKALRGGDPRFLLGLGTVHAFALLVMIVISPLLGRKQTLPILLILFTATWPMIAGGWLLRAVRTILERP